MTPDDPNRVDRGPFEDLGELLALGLERDVAHPVDTGRLIDGAQSGAVRLRRRRTVATVAGSVLLVVGVPLGIGRLGGLLGLQDGGPAAAQIDQHTGSAPATGLVPTGALPAAEDFTGELRDLQDLLGPAGLPHLSVPDSALVTPQDLGASAVVLAALGRRSRSETVTRRVFDTGRQACTDQPQGLQWDLGSKVAGHDQPISGTDPGWQLTVVARALTVQGASAQLRYLHRNLESCSATVAGSWTLEPAPAVGDESVLATGQDGGTVVVVGTVRDGAATAGFWLRVPRSAAASPADRRDLAAGYGRNLLTAAASRLQRSGLSAQAIGTMQTCLDAANRALAGTSPSPATPTVPAQPDPTAADTSLFTATATGTG